MFKEALQDICALKYLENFMAKDEIIKLIEDDAKCELEFDKFPKEDKFIIGIRERINSIIKEKISQL